MATLTNPSTFYGTDSYCVSDIQRVSTQVTDPVQLIAQRIARRLQTPRGALALIGGDPDFGYDVRQLVLAKRTPSFMTSAQSTIQAEVAKDQQVLSCSVQIAPMTGDGLSITVSVQSSDGPFSLVLSVDALTVDVAFSFQGQV